MRLPFILRINDGLLPLVHQNTFASNLQTVLKQQPLGLIFDIDGTLSPYISAPYPQKVPLYSGVESLLQQLQQHAHVAMLSSRAVDDAAAMVNVDDLTYIGTYGAEWRYGLSGRNPVQVLPEAQPYLAVSKRLLDLVEGELSALPLILERKLLGGAIHYYRCSDWRQARQQILSLLEEPVRQANMHFSEGEWTVEIKPPLPEEKGPALRRFIQQFKLKGIVFAGDDLPDLTAFLETSRMRNEGLASLSILVQHVHTPIVLIEHADIVVQEVEGMVALLREIIYMLQK
jgi:trehalose-phosphatase